MKQFLSLSFHRIFPILMLLILSVQLSSCYSHRQTKMNRLIQASIDRQQIDFAQVKNYKAKTDSLLFTDSIHKKNVGLINDELDAIKLKNDSLQQTIKDLQVKVNNKAVFKEQYQNVKSNVVSVHKEVVLDAGKRDTFFSQIDQKLLDPNYEGEAGRLKKMLKNASAQQKKEAAQMTAIQNAKESLVQSGKVDTGTSAGIDKRMMGFQKNMDSIAKEIKTLGQQLNTPEVFKKDFKLIKTRILLIDSVVNKKAAYKEYVLNMIMESISNSKPTRFNMAAFFGAGGYKIPDDKKEFAHKYFSPIVDSLIYFSNKYNAVFRNAKVIVNGYSDASQVSPTSKLYKTLADYLHNDSPTPKELNAALSALRAEEISRFLLQDIKESSGQLLSVEKITFQAEEAGYGEQLPDPSIKNYKRNDDRRRIVVVFWNVMPAE
jgi:hypothetical protein